MSRQPDIAQMLAAGDLAGARKATGPLVGADPKNAALRLFFAELLITDGDWDKAELQLDSIPTDDMKVASIARVRRQVLRAEVKRRQMAEEGRVPDMIREPTAAINAALERLVAWRRGEAASPIGKPSFAGTILPAPAPPQDGDDPAHPPAAPAPLVSAWLRDPDDILAPVCEFLTLNGDYHWVDWSEIATLQIYPPKATLDAIWRPAQVTLDDGTSLPGFLPMIYPWPLPEADGAVKLGHTTRFVATDSGLRLGQGLKLLSVEGHHLTLPEVSAVHGGTPDKAATPDEAAAPATSQGETAATEAG